MALVRWSRPELSVSSEATGRRRNMDRIDWRDVLDAVGKVEMALRRLHTSRELSGNRDLFGDVHVEFLRDRERTKLLSVRADPAVDTLADEVSALVVGANFPASPTAMVVKLTCTFASDAGGGGGWEPDGGEDEGWSGGHDDRAFGDPF